MAHRHPVLAAAHRLFRRAEPLQRAELEARLLAGQADEVIAARCGLSAAAVGAYHNLFFNVRDALDAEACILNVVIGPKVHHGLSFEDHDVLLKLAGYRLGTSAVDHLLAYWADPPVWPVSLTQLDDAALETLRQKLLMQAWILSQALPTDAVTATRLPAIRCLLTQASVLAKGSADEENSPLSAAQMALDLPPFLGEPEAAAFHTATPGSSEEASSARQVVGADGPCPRASQGVSA